MRMRSKFLAIIFLSLFFSAGKTSAQSLPCDVVQILHNPKAPVYYSPDSSRYFVNVQDTAGVFQIYVGNAGDTSPVCISSAYTNGNCCGLFRSWTTRNKLQVQWHASGNYLICAVEKEFYNELLYVPYSVRLGWLQSGLWMDLWAVTPDGNYWYNLANTIHGVTGPAFTPNGNKCAWAEALDSSNLAVDVFGKWKLHLCDFVVSAGTPQFANTSDITPAGARWVEPGNFSPNGTSLLISSDIGITNAEGQDQFILNVTNGNITNLTNSPMVWDEHGIFSPDGNKVLFMSSYPYQSDTNSYHTLSLKTEFMLMDTNGNNLQQLTHFCDTGYVESSPGIAATGFWNYTGTTIYAQSLIFPDYDNWIINFSGNCGNLALGENENEKNNSLQFFPNPSQNILNIETSFEMQNAFVKITNALGQTVKNIPSVSGNKIIIYTSDLENGIYFFQLQSGNKRISRTFVRND